MQGRRNSVNSLPENVDLNQEYISNNNNTDYPTWSDVLNPSAYPTWIDALNPAESPFPNSSWSFSGRDLGESSSSASLRAHISGEGSKTERGMSSSHSVSALSETRLEEHKFPQTDLTIRGRTYIILGEPGAQGPPIVRTPGYDDFLATISLNGRYAGNNDVGIQGNATANNDVGIQGNATANNDVGLQGNSTANNDDGLQGNAVATHASLFHLGRPETGRTPFTSMPSGDPGGPSQKSNYVVDDDAGGAGFTLGSGGPSCKRKAIEGTSAQPDPGENTENFPQPLSIYHLVPLHHNASSCLITSSHAVNSVGGGQSEQLNSRYGIGLQGVVSDVFPPLGASNTDNSVRNFGARGHPLYLESFPFNSPSAGNIIRHTNAHSSNLSSSSTSFGSSLEFGPTASFPSNSSNPSNQLPLMQGPVFTRNMPFTWNGTNPSTGSSSSSLELPGVRGAELHEETSFKNTIQNNVDNRMSVPVPETRNCVQDPTNWNLGAGSSSNPSGLASNSSVGSGSTARAFSTARLRHQYYQTQNRLRYPDITQWTPIQSVESEAGIPRGHISPFPSGPSSPEETMMPSGSSGEGHCQPHSRSTLLMEIPGDEVNGWRSLVAEIDGRERLVTEIRHVLNALRRGENLRSEDYVHFDPFINGFMELHDRHRDMRLDVDNMSYEELLALEERIGNVNTGLSEETILKAMKQRKYFSFIIEGVPSKIEPCCICQEEYAIGETIGILDCGHEFHTDCVKKWLLQKNLCPVCKMIALATREE